MPVAKAIDYAEQHDYHAVLGYCSSGQVAHSLVHSIPPHVLAEDLRVTHTAKGKERVEMGGYRFDLLEERAGRWLIVGFRPE